jgi:hypothetical protein
MQRRRLKDRDDRGKGRRAFFQSFVSETLALVDEARGIPQHRLSALGDLPDDILGRLKPLVSAEIEIMVTDHHVAARRKGEEQTTVLFDTTPENTFAFNHFNGSTTVADIGSKLATYMDWDSDRGFAHVRGLFRRLARLGVCLPGNAIES